MAPSWPGEGRAERHRAGDRPARRRRRGEVFSVRDRLVALALMLVLAVVTLYPLAVLVSTALTPPGEANAGVNFVHNLSLGSFRAAWFAGGFGGYLQNTALVTGAVVVLSLLLSVPAAYATAVLRPRGASWFLAVAVIAFILPVEVLIVPWYYEVDAVGLLNTYWAMILPQVAQSVGFGTFWLYTAFRSLPKSLIEAGILDGASSWTLFMKVLVPNVKPAITTMMALVFLWTWNSFLLPLVMVSTPSRFVVTIGLSAFQGSHFSDYSALAAGSIIAALPVVIVYLLSQRSFLRGLYAGAATG